MGAAVGLLAGVGLFCCWWACWSAPVRPQRRGRRAERLAELAVQAGLPGLRPAVVVVAGALSGLLVAAVLGVVSRSVVLAGGAGLLACAAPVLLLRARARARRAALRELWPDAVDHLASGVRAGLSLPEALSSLATHGPEQLRPAFAAFAADHRAVGRFAPALDRLKDRLADPVADRVVEALRITREVGGSDLGRVLRSLSSFLREDARTRGELEARQSWTVNGARLAVAAPWAVLALLWTRPGTAEAYAAPAGALVLGVGAASSAAAYALMRRLGRLPEDERVLR